MIGSAPVEQRKSGYPRIDPKDYVFSEETIQSLTELALLVRDIRVRQATRQAKSNNPSPHGDENTSNKQDTE